MVQQFHATDFNNPMALAGIETGGFGIKDNFTHVVLRVCGHCVDLSGGAATNIRASPGT